MIEQQPQTVQAEFYIRAVEMVFQSEQAGRPIYEDRTFVRIWIPGDKTTVIDREVTPEDKREFPTQWAAFQVNSDQSQAGMRIDQWPELTPSQRAELNAMGFKTIESIAHMTDAQCQGLGPVGVPMRIKAQRFLGALEDKRGPGRPRKEAEAA
jgi:hypothetical protein